MFVSINIDSENNIYAYGHFTGPIDIGDTIIAGLPGPWPNAVLVKYDPSGNFLWGRSYVPKGNLFAVTKAETIGVDENDNVYVSGSFLGTLTVDTVSITSLTNEDIYINKLDKNGNSKWLIREGVASSFESGGLSAIHHGALYYVLKFQGDSTIVNDKVYRGRSSLNNVTGTVLIKFDTLGAVQWSKLLALPLGDGSYISVLEMDLDNEGNIIAAGSYNKGVDFIDTTFSNSDNLDPFILKYDPDGNFKEAWSKGYETIEYVSSMGVDSDGNYYLSGMFRDSIELACTPLKTKRSRTSHFIARISDISECEVITGVAQSVEFSDIKIFPNPVFKKEGFQIEVAKAMNGPANIKIRDLVWNIIYEQSVSNNSNTRLEVATGYLITGTYFVEIYDGRKLQIKKLVVIE